MRLRSRAKKIYDDERPIIAARIAEIHQVMLNTMRMTKGTTNNASRSRVYESQRGTFFTGRVYVACLDSEIWFVSF